tara:strand:+ start:216 stop:626 length:411 start_codon:yes stop_codon:yes gene_type:complete
MKDNLNKTYKPVREDTGDYYAIEGGTTHSLVAKYLVDSTGDVVYSKPAESIAQASALLWSALNGLDLWRLKYVAKHMPEVFKLAQLYSDVYGSPNVSLYNYIEDMEEMGPNYLEKLKSYRTNPPMVFQGEVNDGDS